MAVIAIPKELRERLGEQGSDALVELLSAVDNQARQDSLGLLSERFERRLSEEIGKLRAEMHDEIGKLRAEIIKWMFIFWIGQITVLGGLIIGLFNLR